MRGKQAIHVAGVIDAAEARLLIDCEVDCLGLPLVLDHHPEDLTASEAAAIVRELGHRATFFLITYLSTAPDIAALCRDLDVAMVQLHGSVDEGQLTQLRASWPELYVLKSLIVGEANFEELSEQTARFAPMVDAFVTDTFDPSTGARGATGKTHDWNISRRLVQRSSKPVILAGGLTPDNVQDAIRKVGPAGVDVHTGVEGSDGRKQREKVARFVAEAREGFFMRNPG